ncbi:MAG: hypothetical protein Q8R37_01095 [Nanoarchaeota archaeon]|nr:hypothetical protein [Nanoarchaeota archaeon]
MGKNYVTPLLAGISALYFGCAAIPQTKQAKETARWFLPQLRFEQDGYRCSRNLIISINDDGRIYQFTGIELCQQENKHKNVQIDWFDTNNDGTIDKVCQQETMVTASGEKKTNICDNEEIKTVSLIHYLGSWLQNRIDL